MSNINLNKAKVLKNGEFYSRLEDVKAEIELYKPSLMGKSIYLPADHPERSQFFRHLDQHFEDYGLKRLTSTFYAEGGIAPYKTIRTLRGTVHEPLMLDGDMFSNECLMLMQESDIVITNPPFSLVGKLIHKLAGMETDFLIMGPLNALCYTSVLPHMMSGKLHTGINTPSVFVLESGETAKLGNVIWYTTLESTVPRRKLGLTAVYRGNDERYQRYENFDAIDVKHLRDIPIDYPGMMAVPVTYALYHDQSQFRILGDTHHKDLMPVPVTFGQDFVEKLRASGNKSHYSAGMYGMYYLNKDGKPVRPFTKLIIQRV